MVDELLKKETAFEGLTQSKVTMAFMSIAAERGLPEGNEEWRVGLDFSPF